MIVAASRSVRLLMLPQVQRRLERLHAFRALVDALLRVRLHVDRELLDVVEALAAILAFVRRLAARDVLDALVVAQTAERGEGSVALGTLERRLGRMDLHVDLVVHVVGEGEVAVVAAVRLFAGGDVGSEVTLEVTAFLEGTNAFGASERQGFIRWFNLIACRSMEGAGSCREFSTLLS